MFDFFFVVITAHAPFFKACFKKFSPLLFDPCKAKNNSPLFIDLVSDERPLTFIVSKFLGQFLISFFNNIFYKNLFIIYG